ncbi:phospho-acceptor domain-containing protein [Hephaestia caeni]|uniref:histidine kinase n=1 Tax=Hephaestia caeni TaxID=645617 RepID=A0A397PCA2_9SPHN|nr:histidine kinase dimerization/phospho-acceptor domain-containing protein [Hephaestia caeni]RIA46588.1 phospho-acceptor domain-containing protein [Hephaestia caeni]
MRFDDSLDTVLSADMSTPSGIESAWRQLVDLIGRRRVPANEQTLGRLAAIREAVPLPVRVASARAIAHGEPPAALVQFFAVDDGAVVAPLLRTARLADEGWIAVLPALSPMGRSLLRHRRDLGGRVGRALESFGSVDFVLPTAAPVSGDDVAEPETPAPLEVPPSSSPSSFVSLGDAALALPVVAEALRQHGEGENEDEAAPPDAEPDGAFQIAELVARIDAFQRRRGQVRDSGESTADAVATAPLAAFDFEADEGGVVRWVSGIERAPIIGLSLLHGATAGSQVDGVAAGAFRRRAPFTDARLEIEGTSRAGGAWRISAIPIFEPLTGRFAGYRGTARRPRADESAAPRTAGIVPDSLRQLVHELRTPTSAIAGFAEMIEAEILGPVADPYRERAAAIRRQARDLLVAIEDLDTAARIEGRALDLRPATVALRPLLDTVAADLAPLAELRGTGLDIAPDMPDLDVLGDALALERLIGRLLAALVAAGARDERIGIEARQDDGRIVIVIDRPRGLAGYSGEALLAIDAEQEATLDGAPLLGTGFSLRLARNLAAELGGKLTIGAERLTLRLPTARIDDVGQVSGH